MKKQNNTFKRYNSIGNKELLAATKVIKKGNLSSFIGAWGNNFYGGEYVRKFEKNCESFFNVKYAVRETRKDTAQNTEFTYGIL